MENIKTAAFDTSFMYGGYYSITPLGNLELLDTYVYYDGPQLFTCKHRDGYKLFSIVVSEQLELDGLCTWNLMKIAYDDEISKLENGEITLREFFKPDAIISCYNHDQDAHVNTFLVPYNIIPEKYLPSEKSTLAFWMNR